MMIPAASDLYDRYYPLQSEARPILLRHSGQVAALALAINEAMGCPLAPAEIDYAASLHDIGICLTDAPGIGCHGSEPYLRHGVLGADMLRSVGAPEWAARVAERHTGAGIYSEDIVSMGLPLPADRVLYPVTPLERLVCYADKFYSKSGDMSRKSLDRVRVSMARHSAATLERFELFHAIYGQYLPK